MQESGGDDTRSARTEEELRSERLSDKDMAYSIQAYRELGTYFMDFSLVNGYVTSDYCDEVCQKLIGVSSYYSGYYYDEATEDLKPFYTWDGGQLMTKVHNWVNTTQKHILFVYGGNDAWTGGAVSVDDGNANVKKIVVPGGIHSHYFLNEEEYDTGSATIIKNTLDRYIKGN